MDKVEFKVFNGQQIIDEEPEVFEQMSAVFESRDNRRGESILKLMDKDTEILCMMKNGEVEGFSWMAFCDKKHIAELCWFATHKEKVRGLEGKALLDKTIEYCRERKTKTLSFNCYFYAWGNIKDKKTLFERYGYKLRKDKNWDMVIDISRTIEKSRDK